MPPEGQLEARLDQTKDDPKDVIGGSLNQPRGQTRAGAAMNSEPFENHFASTKLDSTLVGESKFLQVQADPRAGTMGATWKETGRKELQLTASGFQPDMLEQEKSRKSIKHEIDSSSLGSTSKLLESLPVKNDEDTNDPLRILEGAVNAIREARHEDGAHSLASSAFLSHRTSGAAMDGGFATGEVTQAVEKGRNVAEIPLEDLLQSQGDWGNVLRHFGAESEEQKELRRQDASHSIGEKSGRSEGGYPQKLERLDQTDMSSFRESTQRGSDRVQDSLDLLQDLQFQATNGSQVSGGQLGTLGSLQRPIVKDDFATLAAATPEDFDAFLARLKGQEGDSSRGRSPQVSGMNVKDPVVSGGMVRCQGDQWLIPMVDQWLMDGQ